MKNLKLSKIISVLFFLFLANKVNSSSYDFIKHYYECQTLQMSLVTTDPYQDPYYSPDGNIQGNSLKDSFFQNLGLQNMNFEEGMQFVQQLYKSLVDCETDFCVCVRQRDRARVDNYTIYFEDNNFSGVKSIISSLNEALSNKRKSLEEVIIYPAFGRKKLKTLGQFVYEIEYSKFRLYEYLSYYDCFDLSVIL